MAPCAPMPSSGERAESNSMASPWEQQFKEILQRAGTELRRTGEEMKGEAQRLIEELRDPSRQAKMREQLEELRVWARKASEDATRAVDAAVRKVEGALTQEPQSTRKAGGAKGAGEAKAPRSTEPKAAKKTVGKAAKATGAAKAAAPAPAAKKTVGKKAGAAAATKPAASKGAKAPRPGKVTTTAPKKSVGTRKPVA